MSEENVRRGKTKEYMRAYHAANRERLNAQKRAYYLATKEVRAAKGRERRKNNPSSWRAVVYKAKFGITVDEYEARLVEQKGVCAVCTGRRLAVDHCHATGKVRGLLCWHCNSGIGKLGDNAEGLLRALAYLRAAHLGGDGKALIKDERCFQVDRSDVDTLLRLVQ